MTGEMIGDLLRPLIGKSGTIFMVVSRSGQIGFATGPNRKLTGVELREDGMVRLVRETGWAVIDPSRDRGRGLERRNGKLARPVPVSAWTSSPRASLLCSNRFRSRIGVTKPCFSGGDGGWLEDGGPMTGPTQRSPSGNSRFWTSLRRMPSATEFPRATGKSVMRSG